MERAGDLVRIHVSEPLRLRDYFLRLGARAEIAGDGVVAVAPVAGDDLSVEAYLDGWSAISGIAASVVRPVAVEAPAPEPMFNTRRARVGDLLLAKGMITEAQLQEALIESRHTGQLLGRILLKRQWIFEDELARILAEQLDLPYVNLRIAGINYSFASLMPAEIGMHYATIPIGGYGDSVRVAFADPCDESAYEAVAAHVSAFVPVVAELGDIELAWRTVTRRTTNA